MNAIPSRQNAPAAIDRLAAQRHLYTRAKSVLALAIVLSVPCVVAGSITGALYPPFKPFAALWGIAVALVNILILDRWQRGLTRQAAMVQELFDCEVLEIEWNAVKVGERPAPEDVTAASDGYKKRHTAIDALIDWYPTDVGRLPLPLARVICQRANCTWESRMRTVYAGCIIAALVLVVATVSFVALGAECTMSTFVLAVANPVMPAVLLGAKQALDHLDAARSSEKLASHANGLLSSAKDLSDEEHARSSRLLQDEIFDRRRSAPLVFDFLYRWLRPARDLQMNKAAQELVARLMDTSSRSTASGVRGTPSE